MYKADLYVSFKEIKDERLKKEKVKKDKLYYPHFHIAPEYGLLNDPNGLVYFNDEYHIFYQYHPNNVAHGLKNWYHITTKDFITYEKHGIKIFPEQNYENYGIFSGGAEVRGDELYLYYTGNHRDPENNYKRSPYQCYAVMDKNYNIVEKGVFLEPLDKYTEHYRDPVVIDSLYILLGAQNNELRGVLSLINRKTNEEKTITFKNELEKAYMMECPNYFEIDNRHFLIVSPQGIIDSKYQNINSVVYIETDIINNEEIIEIPHLLDHGFDFYAPQVFKSKNRTLLLAWLGQADTIYPYDQELGWSQLLSMARELKLVGGKLYQYPIQEYFELRGEQVEVTNSVRTSRQYELEMELKEGSKVVIGNEKNVQLMYKTGILELNREKMDVLVNVEYGVKRKIDIGKDKIKVNMFVDNSVLEIFIDGGEYSMSSRFFLEELDNVIIKNIEKCNYYPYDSMVYKGE